jgi:hypothetical protein
MEMKSAIGELDRRGELVYGGSNLKAGKFAARKS